MAEADNVEFKIEWDSNEYDKAMKTTNFPELNLEDKKYNRFSSFVRSSIRSLKKTTNQAAENISINAKIRYVSIFYIKMIHLYLPYIAMIIYYEVSKNFDPSSDPYTYHSNTQTDIREVQILCKQIILYLYYMYKILSSVNSDQNKIYSITIGDDNFTISNLIDAINMHIKNLDTFFKTEDFIKTNPSKASLKEIISIFLKKIPTGSQKFKDELKQEDIDTISAFISTKLDKIPSEKAAVAAEKASKSQSTGHSFSRSSSSRRQPGSEPRFLGVDAESHKYESYGGSRHRKSSSSKSKKSSSSRTQK